MPLRELVNQLVLLCVLLVNPLYFGGDGLGQRTYLRFESVNPFVGNRKPALNLLDVGHQVTGGIHVVGAAVLRHLYVVRRVGVHRNHFDIYGLPFPHEYPFFFVGVLNKPIVRWFRVCSVRMDDSYGETDEPLSEKDTIEVCDGLYRLNLGIEITRSIVSVLVSNYFSHVIYLLWILYFHS